MAANEPPPAPPSYPSAPVSPPSPDPQRRRQFLIGLGIGAVPLLVGLAGLGIVGIVGGNQTHIDSFGVGTLMTAGGIYLLMLVAMLVLSIIPGAGRVALGMLAALGADLVIAFLGCNVIPRLLRPGP